MFEYKLAVGRIGSTPIVLDSSFILLVLLYGSSWLFTGTAWSICMGFAIVAGGVGSILVHELAHAWAGRICRIGTTHIELNGMGGLCFLEKQGERREDEIFILLAGPASNLALWALFHWLAQWSSHAYHLLAPESATTPLAPPLMALSFTYWVFAAVAKLNIAMFVFNLAPSFPLDGGRALAAWLTKRFDLATAVEVVTTLGWGVCAICVYLAFASHPMFMLLAMHLFTANRTAMEVEGRRTWQRWD